MINSKLTFRIQEIPDGKSERRISLDPEDLDFEGLELKQATVEVRFEKTRYFIDVDFNVEADLFLICDRSLDEFEYHVQGSYEVLFKPEVEEVSVGKNSRVKQFDVRDLTLSIDQEVRDTVYLELPVKKLHPRYLDEEGVPLEFETRSFGDSAEEEEDSVDPRWEALKKLKD